MINFVQESVLPKLGQTSLFAKFDETSEIRKAILGELGKIKDIQVKPENLKAILALMELNGNTLTKKALPYVVDETIVILDNPESTNIPISLPFLITTMGGETKAFIFADKIVNNINSSREYPKLMAVVEAAYVALQLYNDDEKFIQNRQLMLTLCEVYTKMTVFPIEQKLYMKGDNLVRGLIYAMAFFYKMIDGPDFNITAIVRRIIGDNQLLKENSDLIKQISDEVRSLQNNSIIDLIELIKKINPVRYENLDVTYLNHFTVTSGASLLFALENISYLFILLSSANHRTQLTNASLNATVTSAAKKVVKDLSIMFE